MSEISQKLRKILIDLNFSSIAKSVGDSEDLFQSGALDSLTLIQFVLALEEDLQIRLENKDITYENFKSFQKMSNFLTSNYLRKSS